MQICLRRSGNSGEHRDCWMIDWEQIPIDERVDLTSLPKQHLESEYHLAGLNRGRLLLAVSSLSDFPDLELLNDRFG